MKVKTKQMFDGDGLAISVWMDKYASPNEVHYDEMHKRMAKEFARIESNYNDLALTPEQFNSLSNYGRSRLDLSEDSIFDLFKDFKYVIPQGSVMSQLGSDTLGSLSNCFVIGQPVDSYAGIFEKDQEMAQLMKRRGGVGIDLSTLRPEGATTSNVARSSTGAVSFMHRYSNTTREVAQNGRRGALMISMDVRHPDIMEFVKIKRDLSKVTGANISIKLTNEFMHNLIDGENHSLRFPVESNHPFTTDIGGSIPAKDLWNEIIKSAHGVAEPGLMYWDNMVKYSPDGIYDEYRPVTTNPCSEIAMQEYDACRLIAVNFSSFVSNPYTEFAKFEFAKFARINYEAMRLSDDLVDLELEHIERILEKIKRDPEDPKLKNVELTLWQNIYKVAKNSRRTGLGFTGVGDMFAKLGLKYGSDQANSKLRQILHLKMKSELDCTTDMAISRGTFKGWSRELEQKGNMFYKNLAKTLPVQHDRMRKYGRRNVSWSTVAPTGSVSILAQTTSGIEPLFQPYYTRRKKINPNDNGVKVDFVDAQGDSWTEFKVLHPEFKNWLMQFDDYMNINELSEESLQNHFKQSPWYGSTANDISWEDRLNVQALIQKYITHSISSTINLPNDASEEEVSNIYLKAWELGLKGITVYRDGSRDGVLITDTKSSSEEFTYNDAKKRPKTLECDVHLTKYRGSEFVVFVGLYGSRPYEVFALENVWDIKPTTGSISKKGNGIYDVITKEDITIEDITKEMTHEEESITRMLSFGLRHGGDITFAVEQLRKAKGDITSFSKAIARVLNKYTKDRSKKELCPNCSSELVREEGCHNCKSCGYSRCS